MTVYIFDVDKRVRKIVPENGLTELIHDEASYILYATVSMDYGVENGEHIGFRCDDGKFRIFTVTNSENKDDDHTTIITATDAIVQELKEIIIEEKQQLDVGLKAAIEGLLDAAGMSSLWSVTGQEPDRVEKSRAYYSTLWAMMESYMVLYEWQIIPYYTFYGNGISGRVIELKEDKAEFRGRILKSKKDASNVYVIKNNPPITRLYGIGPATGTGDIQTNMTFSDVSWSISGGDPANKPKGQAWVEDSAAVAKYGWHTAVIQINEVEDEKKLLEKTWEELQRLKEPTCTVEATVQDLEMVPGYEKQIIRLGDLVPIRLSNAKMEAARVINIKRNYLQRWLTKIIIGDKEATIQSQVSSLITSAAHTFERLTIYKNRFHEDEALIQLNAEFIQMNAETIEMNAKEIRANAELIDLKAGKEEVTELGTRVSAAEIRIDGLEAQIELKASKLELTEFESRLSSAEIRIDGAEAAIELKADRTEFDALSSRMTSAEVKIDGLEAEIKLIATESSINELKSQVSEAMIRIDGAEAAIEMKAEQTYVDALSERISQAEIDIDGANAQISLKASQSTVDEMGKRLTSAELLIDGQNSRIEAKADLILLNGYVKTTELEAKVINVFDANIESAITQYLSANELDVQSLVAASVNTNYLSADSITSDTLRVGGYDLGSASLTMGPTTATLFAPSDINLSHSHAVTVNADGTITLGEVATTGGSFKIADTQYYKDGVSAAKKEGADSVTLSNFGWQGGRNLVEASNGQSLYVDLPEFSVSGGDTFYSNKTTVYFSTSSVSGYLASKTVDATSVYNSGSTAGKNSVTLSAAGWVGGSNVVSASNGKSVTVSLPTFSVSGGDTFYSNKTTVYFSTSSVSSPLASKTVDATSVYNSGSTAGKNSVTLSAAGWVSGSNVVSASNGKSVTVNLPAFSTSGGTSFNASHQTTVYFYTGSVSAPLASKVVDASSVYDAGYTAGQGAGGGSYDEGYEDGKASVTLSQTAWSDGSKLVLASNGKLTAVFPPTLTFSASNFNENNITTITITGAGVTLKTIDLDATAVYDKGYKAGYEAAKAATTVVGGISYLYTIAANTYRADGWARANVDGEQVDYTTFSKVQTIS